MSWIAFGTICSFASLYCALCYIKDQQLLSFSGFLSRSVRRSPNLEGRPDASNTAKVHGLVFRYMRIVIAVFAVIYPIWYTLTYHPGRVYSENSCQVFTRIESFLITLLRILVLIFYIFRLKLVSDSANSSTTRFSLTSLLFVLTGIAFFFGMFEVLDLRPYALETGGCEYEEGEIGFAGYTIFICVCFGIHLVLCWKFVRSIQEHKLHMERFQDRTQQSPHASSSLDAIIRSAKLGFLVYSVVAITADTIYIFTYYVFYETVFEGPRAEQLYVLVIIIDVLYYLDAVSSCFCVMSTHNRFGRMLKCGYQGESSNISKVFKLEKRNEDLHE